MQPFLALLSVLLLMVVDVSAQTRQPSPAQEQNLDTWRQEWFAYERELQAWCTARYAMMVDICLQTEMAKHGVSPAFIDNLRKSSSPLTTAQASPPLPSSVTSPAAETIALTKEGGVYALPVEINGVMTLPFILDSGASEVSIPADVARTLLRSGTIKDTDFLPGKKYVLADGSQLKSPRFTIRSLKIGSRRITNVSASVGDLRSPLLLGQSLLEKLGTWGIDN